MSLNNKPVISELEAKFGDHTILYHQATIDGTPTIWLDKNSLLPVLKYLKNEITQPYKMLFDLTAIDERYTDVHLALCGGQPR